MPPRGRAAKKEGKISRDQTFVADCRAPETTLDELRSALPELDQTSQTRVQILVAEILAQARKVNGEQGAFLKAHVTPSLIRIEAVGAQLAPRPANGGRDPLAEWGAFIFERVSDRWGLDDLEGKHLVWFEVDRRGAG